MTYFDSLVKENNIDEVKKFAFILLKTRFLFDLYVVKTDSTEKEHWSLKMPQYDTNNSLYYKNTFDNSEKEQDCVLMILSMFHTSYPSRNYKNWLYAVLRGLVLNEWSKKYLEKLEILSDRFYFNIYQNSQDFFDVIYNEPDILDSP
ncbi:TPA: hypothetical protein QB395_002102, partial [Pasteurella multocida]|nr:hypothetical protein [Pasteurella multocida]